MLISRRNALLATMATGVAGFANAAGAKTMRGNAMTVRPEDFGTPGTGANDNDLFLQALATGLPVAALGQHYNLDALEWDGPADLTFGRNTVVENVQAAGPATPTVTFAGEGLIGTAVSVTAIERPFSARYVTVSDASQFSVGDAVLLQETQGLTLETGVDAPTYHDMNYREYLTIMSISGNEITFEEFLRFPHSTSKGLKLQRASLLEGVHVRGGKFIGGANCGAAVKLSHCRLSSVSDLVALGVSDAVRLNGAGVAMADNWECHVSNIMCRWTRWVIHSGRCQSSVYSDITGKRTSAGGTISSGDRFCDFLGINHDSPGDDNGDGLGLHNGSRRNRYQVTISSARCYAAWVHQGCEDNEIDIVSTGGITSALCLYGDRNRVRTNIRAHPSNGVILQANDNILDVDIEAAGTGIRIWSGKNGNQITGRAVTHGTGPTDYGLVVGSVQSTRVRLKSGSRKFLNAAGGTLHSSNDIQVY